MFILSHRLTRAQFALASININHYRRRFKKCNVSVTQWTLVFSHTRSFYDMVQNEKTKWVLSQSWIVTRASSKKWGTFQNLKLNLTVPLTHKGMWILTRLRKQYCPFPQCVPIQIMKELTKIATWIRFPCCFIEHFRCITEPLGFRY